MTSDHLDGSGLGLRDRGRGLTEDRASDLLGIEAVGLAVHATGQPVGPVHLHDPFAGLGQCPGQGGTEGSGAFDTDRTDLTVSAHPGQQPLIAAVGGGELLVTEQPPCWSSTAA